MEERFKRKPMESDESYQIRLTLMKQEGIDLDWSEIAELVGDGRSSEAYRKDSYGIRRYHNYSNSIKMNDVECDQLEELNSKLSEIKIEKIKLADERAYLNKKYRQFARMEDMRNSIIDEIKESNDMSYINNEYRENITTGKECLLLISDVHYGLSVQSGFSEYNENVCVERLNTLVNKTIDYCNLHGVNKLNLILGGDLISNELKTTIRIENRLDLSKQITGISKILSECIYKLSQNIPYVVVGMCMGNHERSISNYKDALSTDSYLPIIKDIITLRVEKLKNVVLLENKYDEFCMMRIHGKNYIAMHGDRLRGSLDKNSIRQVEGMLDIKCDYLLLGHYHQGKEFYDYESKIIIGGSLVGSDDYSRKLMLKSTPMQKMMIIDDLGDIECTYDIKL